MKRSELRAFRWVYATWLLGLFGFFLPAATWSPVSRLDLTRALVERGSLWIDDDAANTGDRALVRGHWFSDKAPLPSFAAAPVYAAMRGIQRVRGLDPSCSILGTEQHPAVRVVPNPAFRQLLYACSLATSGIAGVAVGLLLFELLRRRTTSRVALEASTLVLLGTPLFPYATSFYGHVPAAALLLGALVSLDRRGARPEELLPSPRRLRVAGACLALAAACEYLCAAPAFAAGVWFVVRCRPEERVRALRELALGALLPALALAWYHSVAFGAPWRTGYSFEADPVFRAGHASGLLGIHRPSWAGLFGLTVGVRRGLLYLSPVATLGVLFGVAHVRRRRDWAMAGGLACLGILFVLNAGYYMWWGGAAAGPRHLIPGLPYLAAGIVLGLRSGHAWVRGLTRGVGLLSVLQVVAVLAVGIEAPARTDILYGYAWPRLLNGQLGTFAGGSNLGLKLGLPGAASLLLLALWGLFGFRYLRRQLKAASDRLSRAPS